jgi:hypothetical protein
MQYFKKGFDAVAKNLNRLLCKMKVVTFQLIKKIPMATPMMAALKAFTLPKYSGTKNNASAPKLCIKPLSIVLANNNQNNKITWYLRKCKTNNCIGKE